MTASDSTSSGIPSHGQARSRCMAAKLAIRLQWEMWGWLRRWWAVVGGAGGSAAGNAGGTQISGCATPTAAARPSGAPGAVINRRPRPAGNVSHRAACAVLCWAVCTADDPRTPEHHQRHRRRRRHGGRHVQMMAPATVSCHQSGRKCGAGAWLTKYGVARRTRVPRPSLQLPTC